MKKICLLFMLFISLYLLFGTRAYAQDDGLPLGKNYLDLSLLRENESSRDTYYQRNPFKVKPNTVYTLVLSETALGAYYNTIDDYEIEFSFYEDYEMRIGGDFVYAMYVKDDVNQRAYVEFTTIHQYLLIEYMIYDVSDVNPNYEIMIYEGSYADFTGFEPYLSPDEILNYQGELKINYDELLSTDTIKSYVSAKDAYQNPVATNLLSDNYSSGSKLPGKYQMVFEATHNQISKTFTLQIEVYDATKPVISASKPLRIPLTEKVSIETLKSYFTVTDNVDTISYDTIDVIDDNYSTANSVGIYQVVLEVSDSSMNKTTTAFDVELYDEDGPIIEGPSQIYLYVGDSALTHADVLGYYRFKDNVGVDETSIKIIHDEYLTNNEPGTYLMTVSATDTSSNTSTRDIYIHIVDNRGPEFDINETYIITTSPTQIKSEEDIITWLSMTLKDEGVDASNITIDHNEYEMRSTESGSYYVYMNYDVNDETYQTRVMIDVVDDQTFNMLYLLGIIPVVGILTLSIYIYRKRKLKI